jgi:predicted RNA-binding protein YlqC (UPF0109 family)
VRSKDRSSRRHTAGGGAMKEFLEFVARHLVDHPDQVCIETEEKDQKLVFKLKVEEGDVGKIIGRSGKTASALRVLLRAVAAKEGKRAVLDIIG